MLFISTNSILGLSPQYVVWLLSETNFSNYNSFKSEIQNYIKNDTIKRDPLEEELFQIIWEWYQKTELVDGEFIIKK